ncbi:ABC transporter ATP-binding protein [Bacillus mycoides]|uniref:ABC transporter ATP-binding protein n=1 Tax=Bacillus mycoides TaxID=1405 RepID=UPI00030853C7|nr:ABC transporter ATP-binding protein [Bacillus mycoides]AIW85174.1 ABC transporter family protein [Bacillus mycoides]MCQ6529731.1 ABC transporter ATP-binding protein [Bacillus mycoides]QWH60979.1 ABC transporter ATP-binding protein [Bacillus mycoides]GAE38383.1 putative ABC transporter ATP-binding protein [Bacillus mycoides NBRC 101238 = DSM 11821]HDR7596182.1 ABC transporter ATP-binding protein [Bacillus mycoides]
MKKILEVKQLNKKYAMDGNKTCHMLKNINLEIYEGEFISVMGPSGSGKSTLLYNISGMDQMSSGSVKVDSKEITCMKEEGLAKLRLSEMGFIFQQSNLLRNLNLFDNIVLPAYLAKVESRKIINKRALELMKKTGISQIATNNITEASGGELQRVSICRALINKPNIIFADEPTGALNLKATEEVMDILANINRMGTTIMLVTHDVKVAAKTERVLFMVDGEIVSEIQMGKYRNDDLKVREEQLLKWLTVLGF